MQISETRDTPSVTEELKPCPFCGGDEISHGYNDPPPAPDLYGIVQCHTCDAFMLGADEREAIRAWSARTEPGPPIMDKWNPGNEDPFWMLEAEDGEWLKNERTLSGTRDPAKALRFPTEREAAKHPALMAAGSKWWSAKPTEHTWIKRSPHTGLPDDIELFAEYAEAKPDMAFAVWKARREVVQRHNSPDNEHPSSYTGLTDVIVRFERLIGYLETHGPQMVARRHANDLRAAIAAMPQQPIHADVERLVAEWKRLEDAFHDNLPDQGECGDPSHGKALCQFLYDNSETLRAALLVSDRSGVNAGASSVPFSEIEAMLAAQNADLISGLKHLRSALARAIDLIEDAEKDTNWCSGDPYGDSATVELRAILNSTASQTGVSRDY